LATITYSHHGLLASKRNAAIFGTLLTIVLAIIFTGLQAFEYAQSSITIADSVFGSAFFCATGLHGYMLPLSINFNSPKKSKIFLNYYKYSTILTKKNKTFNLLNKNKKSFNLNKNFHYKIKNSNLSNKNNKMKRFYNWILRIINIFYRNINFLNVISVIFLGLIIYKFFYDNDIFDIILIFFSFIIFFLITHFIFDIKKRSDNFFIRFIQNFIISIFIFLLIQIILINFSLFFKINFLYTTIYCDGDDEAINNNNKNNNILDEANTNNNSNDKKEVVEVKTEKDNNNEYYSFKIRKDIVDNTGKTINDLGKSALEKFIPNLGVGAATGSATAAMIKATAGLPPVQRGFAVGSTSLVTAASTKVGIGVGERILKRIDIESTIKESKHANTKVDFIPSPDDDSNSFIFSPTEAIDKIDKDHLIFEESNLEFFLTSIFTLNFFILFLTISLLILIFNNYILKNNLEFISSLVEKYLPKKIKDWFKKRFNKSIDYNNRFILIMFIVNSFVLIMILLLNMISISELLNNLDYYVTDYIQRK